MYSGGAPLSGFGATIFGCDGPRITAEEQAFYAEAQPFGFILFARNVETPAQLTRLTHDLRDSVGREAPVLIDQEGGRVQRMRAPYWREFLPPLDESERAGAQAERAFYLRYRLIADELRAVGINANCAPTADVAIAGTHPFLRNRCYGQDVETVVKLARATASGLQAGGVLPVMKHIPGHGRATLDSHKELPRVSEVKSVLQDVDFATFRQLSDMPMGMSAHIVFEDIDPKGPATTSARMTELIRSEIGFDGLLMTDDLSMEALSGNVVTRARDSIAAQMDVVLHCNGKLDEMQAIAGEVGRMTPAAQRRAEAALAQQTAPDDADIEALWAEHQALTKG